MIVVMILSQRVEHGIQEFWQRYAAGADVLQNVQSLCGDVIPCDGVAHKRISLKNNLVQKRAHCNQAKNIDFLDGAAQQKLAAAALSFLSACTNKQRPYDFTDHIDRQENEQCGQPHIPPSKQRDDSAANGTEPEPCIHVHSDSLLSPGVAQEKEVYQTQL